MKIATFNVNSIRKRLPIVLEWVEKHRPEVMGLQETKVEDAAFPAEAFRQAGYHVTFRGQKGYNGVATLTLAEPTDVVYGFRIGHDAEDVRVLTVAAGGVTVVNTYVPQGYKVGTDKYRYKLDWFQRVREFFQEQLDPAKPAVWIGDMNVAPEPIDVYHPDRRVNDVDFHIDARNAYRAAAAWGWTDVFRRLYPERVQYTYWDYFRHAFENNWGWRIDHVMATAPLAATVREADADLEPRRAPGASDHTVMWAEFGD